MSQQWTCEACTFVNIGAASFECSMCGCLRTNPPESSPNGKTSWSCPACTLENSAGVLICDACGYRLAGALKESHNEPQNRHKPSYSHDEYPSPVVLEEIPPELDEGEPLSKRALKKKSKKKSKLCEGAEWDAYLERERIMWEKDPKKQQVICSAVN